MDNRPNTAGASLPDDEEPATAVTITCCTNSPQAVVAAQKIRLSLYRYGIPCTMVATTSTGGIRWRTETVNLIKRSCLFIPLIDCRWCLCGGNVLEAYYALRRHLVSGKPVLLPILFPDVISQLDSPKFAIAKQLSEKSFHILWQPPLEDIVQKIPNFLKQMEFEVCPVSVQGGSSFPEIYQFYLTSLGGKKANSGVVKMLRTLKESTEINLANNYIGDLGLKALLPLLHMKPDVKHLNLQGNGISNAAVHNLVDTLVTHPGIVSVNLSHNDISHSAAVELFWLIRQNEQITSLDLTDTCIKAVWHKRIQNKLTANKKRAFANVNRELLQQAADYSDDSISTNKLLFGSSPKYKWNVRIQATSQDKGEVKTPTFSNIIVSVKIELRSGADGSLIHKTTITLTSTDADQADLLKLIQTYLQSVITNTIAVTKYTGMTIKYVLEDNDEGLEQLHLKCQQYFLKVNASNMNQQVELNKETHETAITAVFTQPSDTRGNNFFVEGSTLYHDGGRVGKELVQLFRENVYRFQGSINEEVGWLVSKVYQDDLVREEDLALMSELERQEEAEEEDRQEKMMDGILKYWTANPEVYRTTVDNSILERFQKKEASVTTETASCTSDAMYARQCLQLTDYPPYDY